ncbi:type I-C CRISPR-associated protein Cas5c [Brucella sp. IR073]|uniref:type I-C CRISPR-associated protein Cas5c n=1 Tax=unclassified Brucella TaxID=2632610 RepID=UPI003B97F19A
MTYGIRLRVWGNYACFTRAENKAERLSYEVMTPSAARGILEAIHWKPAIRWIVDAIHILEPPRFQSIRRNEVGTPISADKAMSAMKRGSLDGLHSLVDEDRQQRAATVLVKPEYVIAAHFELTSKAEITETEGKHLDIFNRRARRGQSFHQPCLGTREFAAYFELIEPDAPTPEPRERTRNLGFGEERRLGLMLWDIDHQAKGKPSLLFDAVLRNGVMNVPRPGSPEIFKREVRS